MKKIILLLITLTPLLCNSQSQNEVTFKVQFKPNTQYAQTIEQTTKNDMKYSGPAEFLQKLKDRGVQNPMITESQSKIESVFKTGKQTDGTNFPLTMEFVKTTPINGKKIIPDGTLIYGHGSNGNMPTLDSIVSKDLDENLKKTVLQSAQSTFSQLSFPEKRVKIGESFSIDSPLSIPIAGTTVDMTITTNYKLLNVKNGIADFDVSSVYTLKSNMTKYTINATGTSKGKLQYDVTKGYYTKYETDAEIKMQMKLENFEIDLNSKTGSIQTIVMTNI
ncbi:DUF6263 family protein [Flavobacterium sp. WC2509]|uniref:DUF6263 family protein n=1 Tax=Flavobacterium sp. WC2509 TaxID=3461406 RepID=UPI004043A3F0